MQMSDSSHSYTAICNAAHLKQALVSGGGICLSFQRELGDEFFKVNEAVAIDIEFSERHFHPARPQFVLLQLHVQSGI